MSLQKRSPCKTCPFRDDHAFTLSVEKVAEIVRSLQGDLDFPCHYTTTATGCNSNQKQGCIGAATFLEHTRAGGLRANLSFRIREAVYREFTREQLDMSAPVFVTEAAFIAARAALGVTGVHEDSSPSGE